MAHITWIIGNGFDINLGLQTRYTDFYKVYTSNTKNDNDIIKDFKKTILQDEASGWKNWADFELGMGKQSLLFNGKDPVKDFLTCYRDFIKSFHEYLENECSKIKWDYIGATKINTFNENLLNFHLFLTKIQARSIEKIKEMYGNTIKYSFLQLNYTNTFDKLIYNYIEKEGINQHLHGALNKNPIIGVDNINQIENKFIRDDISVQQIFVKQGYLNLLQNRDVNTIIPAENILYTISDSIIFCIFGASIGETDLYWWQKIGERLKTSDALLIIFDVCGQQSDNIDPVAVFESETIIKEHGNNIINQFLNLSGLGENWINDNPNRIIVEFDRPIFDFKLPKKEDEE